MFTCNVVLIIKLDVVNYVSKKKMKIFSIIEIKKIVIALAEKTLIFSLGICTIGMNVNVSSCLFLLYVSAL